MLTLPSPKTIDLQAKLFRGFSDPSRLSIMEALRTGPQTVTEIVRATGSRNRMSPTILPACAIAASSARSRMAALCITSLVMHGWHSCWL
ncbi:hypothetical protein EMGBD1_13590 [Anaerolineaceae bacterium]|nr:hypothetical protein EMGBD1_13590 [Anaerolineaceae bacterium]